MPAAGGGRGGVGGTQGMQEGNRRVHRTCTLLQPCRNRAALRPVAGPAHRAGPAGGTPAAAGAPADMTLYPEERTLGHTEPA